MKTRGDTNRWHQPRSAPARAWMYFHFDVTCYKFGASGTSWTLRRPRRPRDECGPPAVQSHARSTSVGSMRGLRPGVGTTPNCPIRTFILSSAPDPPATLTRSSLKRNVHTVWEHSQGTSPVTCSHNGTQHPLGGTCPYIYHTIPYHTIPYHTTVNATRHTLQCGLACLRTVAHGAMHGATNSSTAFAQHELGPNNPRSWAHEVPPSWRHLLTCTYINRAKALCLFTNVNDLFI